MINEHITFFIRPVLILLLGIPLVSFLSTKVGNLFSNYQSHHFQMLSKKFIFYFGVSILFITSLHSMGFHLTAFLGAAGIVGAAVAYASSTCVSNVISGLLLLAEDSFAIDDFLHIGTLQGTVTSIDLLSIKLQTPNNEIIRIPNEHLIKEPWINLSKLNLHRFSLTVNVPYDSSFKKVKECLDKAIQNNAYIEKKHTSVITVSEVTHTALCLNILVWGSKDDGEILKKDFFEDFLTLLQEPY